MTNQQQYDILKKDFEASFRSYIELENKAGNRIAEELGDMSAFPDLDHAYKNWRTALLRYAGFRQQINDSNKDEEYVVLSHLPAQYQRGRRRIYTLLSKAMIFFKL